MHSLEFEYKHGFLTKRDYENTDVNVITERVKTAKPLYAVIAVNSMMCSLKALISIIRTHQNFYSSRLRISILTAISYVS